MGDGADRLHRKSGAEKTRGKKRDQDGFSVTSRTKMHTCFHTCYTVLPVPLAHPQLPVIRMEWLGGCGYVERGGEFKCSQPSLHNGRAALATLQEPTLQAAPHALKRNLGRFRVVANSVFTPFDLEVALYARVVLLIDAACDGSDSEFGM